MKLHSDSHVIESSKIHLNKHDDAILKIFSDLIAVRADELVKGPDRLRVLSLMKRVVDEVHETLELKGISTEANSTQKVSVLPVNKLKVSEVIKQGLVGLSPASFYRAMEQKRFYSVTRSGRAIGKEIPAWQFISPVPELIPPVLQMFNDMPDSEIHAFWISEAEELNSLSPAEVLAGLPFSTRKTIFPSQSNILNADVKTRASRVNEFAGFKLRNVADLIG